MAFDGRASTRKQVVEIEAGGAKLRFVVKGMGAHESDEITAKYAKINMMTGQTEFDMTKFPDYRFEILRKVLVEAPFELNDANFKDIDQEVAYQLLDAIGLGPTALESRKNLPRR